MGLMTTTYLTALETDILKGIADSGPITVTHFRMINADLCRAYRGRSFYQRLNELERVGAIDIRAQTITAGREDMRISITEPGKDILSENLKRQRGER